MVSRLLPAPQPAQELDRSTVFIAPGPTPDSCTLSESTLEFKFIKLDCLLFERIVPAVSALFIQFKEVQLKNEAAKFFVEPSFLIVFVRNMSIFFLYLYKF